MLGCPFHQAHGQATSGCAVIELQAAHAAALTKTLVDDSHRRCPPSLACSCGASSTSGPPAAQLGCCGTCQRR